MIVIVGAGITGLVAGYRLAQRGVDFEVIDPHREVGGVIRSEERDGYLLEWGPHSVVTTGRAVFDLADELGIGGELLSAGPAARHRYIFRDGALRALPMGPGSFLTTRVLSTAAKLRIFAEPFIRSRSRERETVGEFFRRRFGPEVVEYLVGPFVSGIYAAHPEKLEMVSAFPRIARLEREAGSVIRGGFRKRPRGKARRQNRRRGTYGFRHGMSTLVRALSEKLEGRLRLGARATRLERGPHGWTVTVREGGEERDREADGVILTAPARESGRLLERISPRAAELLERIPYAPVGIVQVGLPDSALPRPLDGFGFLVPRCESLPILGAIWSSALLPGRAPEGHALMSVFLGGLGNERMGRLSSAELAAVAVDGLTHAMGPVEPTLCEGRWIRDAIAQYVPGHAARRAELAAIVDGLPGLHLAGGFLDGVSMHDCVRSGAAAAAHVGSAVVTA